MNFRHVLAVALLSCLVVSAVAQAATLKGTVWDKSGLEMPGVIVHVVNKKSSQKYTLITDDVGVFYLHNAAAGQYSIQTKMPGFKTTTLSNVTVKDGKDTTVKLTINIGVD
jgi:hypothetical protein